MGRGALPGKSRAMPGWDTAKLEWGDTCGLLVRKNGSEIVGYRNGEEVGSIQLEEVIHAACWLYKGLSL